MGRSANKAASVSSDDGKHEPEAAATEKGGAAAAPRPPARSRVARYGLAVLVVAVIGGIAATLGVLLPRLIDRPDRKMLGVGPGTNITLVCQATRYPGLCRSSLNGDPRSSGGGPAEFLVLVSVDQARTGVAVTLDNSRWLLPRAPNDNVSAVAADCAEVLDMAVARLATVTASWDDQDPEVLVHWLSAVLTWQTDCWNALSKPPVTDAYQNLTMVSQANDTITMLSNSVSMTRALASFGPDPGLWRPPGSDRGDGLDGPDGGGYSTAAAESVRSRYGDLPETDFRLMPVGNGWKRRLLDLDGDGYPHWLSKGDRRLLQAAPLGSVVPSVIVSHDLTGQFRTVQDAVNAAPANSATRWVIYIKNGTYVETVVVPSNRTNLMFLGDGMNRTIITNNRNVMMPNVTTFNSATVAVNADGFLAYGVTFQNTAGPANHQAVALRLDSDLAALQNCSFVGYQDTLYTHTLRQFFTQCLVVGTIDFIFGNSASVFQKCDIKCRPGDPQVGTCTITAQGRTDPAQNTGYVLQNCSINGTIDYMQGFYANPTHFKGWLGRPWKLYSRTILSRTQIESMIQPEGWLPWDGTFALDTLFYGEFASFGPGARNLSARVPWSRQLTQAQVKPYSVSNFIQGNVWLPQISLPFGDL